MPQLFGTDYLLPIVVIVVLLIALLVLLAVRRRSATSVREGTSGRSGRVAATAEDTAAETTAATAAAVPAPSPSAVVPPSAALSEVASSERLQEPPSTPRPAQPTVPLAPAVRPGPAARPAAAAAPSVSQPLADPLRLVLDDLLRGWGDLTSEETRRLEIFRPEKVIAAINALELPKGKAAEDARTRLTQLRQYAGDLERRLKVSAALAGAAEAEITQTAPGGAGETAAGGYAEVTPAEAAQTAVAAAEPPDVAIPRSAGPERSWFGPPEPAAAAPAPAVTPSGQEDMLRSQVFEAPSDTPRSQSLTDLESFWVESETVWEKVPEQHVEEPTLEIRQETLTIPGEEAEVLPTEEAEVRPPEEADSLARLQVTVKTAADVLSLPTVEQVEMVAFLEPWELAAVFQATRSAEVKRAVIDTLTRIASPAALSALGTCLDDPDPAIQVYALDAAERLLGKVD